MFVIVLEDLVILELRDEQEVQLSTITNRYLNALCMYLVCFICWFGLETTMSIYLVESSIVQSTNQDSDKDIITSSIIYFNIDIPYVCRCLWSLMCHILTANCHLTARWTTRTWLDHSLLYLGTRYCFFTWQRKHWWFEGTCWVESRHSIHDHTFRSQAGSRSRIEGLTVEVEYTSSVGSLHTQILVRLFLAQDGTSPTRHGHSPRNLRRDHKTNNKT